MNGGPRGIIILEGADGTGKTTLARAICARYGAAYIHGHYYPHHAWAFHLAMLRRACRLSQERLVVVDRHWISEAIYGRVYRGAGVHGALARMFYRIWYRFGALYVLCLPDTTFVVETFDRLKKERTEQYADQMGEVNDRYLRLWHGEPDVAPLAGEDYVDQLTRRGVKNDPTRWVDYDYRYWPDEKVHRFVEGLAWKLETLRKYTWAPGLDYGLWNFAGNGHGKVLLVGDKTNVDGSPRGVYWPFTAKEGSAAYLARTLHALAVDEDDIAIVNANEVGNGILSLDSLPDKIVALGKYAEEGLKLAGLSPHVVIRHPQAARRFAYRDRSYEEELGVALGPEVRRL